MAEFSGPTLYNTIYSFQKPSGSGTIEVYLNASFDTGLPPGSNVVRWFTTGAADPTRASAPAPVGAYSDFWVEDIIGS